MMVVSKGRFKADDVSKDGIMKKMEREREEKYQGEVVPMILQLYQPYPHY